MKCLVCRRKTSNPKYCSHSCAAKRNNKLYPKRKPNTHKCKKCDKLIRVSRMHCKDCREKTNQTLRDIMYLLHHKSSAFAIVRSRARSKLKSLGIKSCINCGYDKHIEACHKKPISSFYLDTKISVINDSKNLIPLCPNCHWEFDKGILNIEKIINVQIDGLEPPAYCL